MTNPPTVAHIPVGRYATGFPSLPRVSLRSPVERTGSAHFSSPGSAHPVDALFLTVFVMSAYLDAFVHDPWFWFAGGCAILLIGLCWACVAINKPEKETDEHWYHS